MRKLTTWRKHVSWRRASRGGCKSFVVVRCTIQAASLKVQLNHYHPFSQAFACISQFNIWVKPPEKCWKYAFYSRRQELTEWTFMLHIWWIICIILILCDTHDDKGLEYDSIWSPNSRLLAIMLLYVTLTRKSLEITTLIHSEHADTTVKEKTQKRQHACLLISSHPAPND